MQKRSNSETGHAKNVANLDDLIARCNSYGSVYNPSREELQIVNLKKLYQEGQAVLHHLSDCEVKTQDATNHRAAAFKALRSLVTRIINTMIACGVSEKSIEDARAIQRRINGTRANKKNDGEETAANEESAEITDTESEENEDITTPRTVSTSRQSYDLLMEHFSKLVLLVKREAGYLPNEQDLQVKGLQAHEQDLRKLLAAATIAETELEAARIRRTTVLYNPKTGLVAHAKQAKSYVKALFGAASPQYKQVRSIRFRNIV